MKINTFKIACMIFTLLGATSCAPSKDTFVLPDISNLTVEKVQEILDNKVNVSYVDYPNDKYIEGYIYGYENKNVGDSVEIGSDIVIRKSVRSTSSVRPSDFSSGGLINYTTELYQLSGKNSFNHDICQEHGVSGCDLGIPFTLPDGRIMMLYGDTFSGENRSGFWNSNYMAITTDDDLTDGLTFDELITYQNGMVKPFAQGLHNDDDEFNRDVEVTKIPTGAITINNEVYIFYMSVRWWGPYALWNVTYNQCVKATDDTYENWVEVPGLRWTDEECYYLGQIYPIEEPNHPDYTYFVCTAGGRHHGDVMMRVKNEHFENRDEYEYLVAPNTWEKGDTGFTKLHTNPYFIYDKSSIEPQIFYSEYLQKYLMINAGSNSEFYLYYSDDICGPYNTYTCLPVAPSDSRCAGNGYGPFFHSFFTDYDGQRLFMQISRWETYVTYVVEVVFK